MTDLDETIAFFDKLQIDCSFERKNDYCRLWANDGTTYGTISFSFDENGRFKFCNFGE